MIKMQLLFCAICIIGVSSWDNNFGGDLFKNCPAGQAVFRVVSTFSNFIGDRRFRFDCKDIPGGWNVNCAWHGVNDAHEPLINYCPMGRVMRGVFSFFESESKDRRWYIYCCGSFQRKMEKCRSSWPGTSLEDPFTFVHPDTYVFGIVGFYSQDEEDRRFHFGYCELSSMNFGDLTQRQSENNATLVRAVLFKPESEPKQSSVKTLYGKEISHVLVNKRYGQRRKRSYTRYRYPVLQKAFEKVNVVDNN